MSKSLLEMSTEIISAQARYKVMTLEEITDSLRSVFQALRELQQVGHGLDPTESSDASDSLAYLRRNPLKSMQRNQIICLESGKPYKLLSNRHLALYGMTPREYKKKWGIPMTVPLSARSLTNRRRKLAKELGMGKQLAEWRARRKKEQIG
ncbi:MAG: MucR family transcriptional regulator [Candidatus Tectomicrobia bacterium]|nr:MucR family transcriptional regulator [Candidatus Tectomicrobia bacterium]